MQKSRHNKKVETDRGREVGFWLDNGTGLELVSDMRVCASIGFGRHAASSHDIDVVLMRCFRVVLMLCLVVDRT